MAQLPPAPKVPASAAGDTAAGAPDLRRTRIAGRPASDVNRSAAVQGRPVTGGCSAPAGDRRAGSSLVGGPSAEQHRKPAGGSARAGGLRAGPSAVASASAEQHRKPAGGSARAGGLRAGSCAVASASAEQHRDRDGARRAGTSPSPGTPTEQYREPDSGNARAGGPPPAPAPAPSTQHDAGRRAAAPFPSSAAVDPATSPLVVRDLTIAYRRRPVLWDVDLAATDGVITGIVGPNGAGKSTLLKGVLDLVPRVSGAVTIYGKPYRQQRRLVAYVPQRESVDWDYPVSALDLVAMGLYRSLGWLRPVGRATREAARAAMDLVGMADYAGRQISELSGGQQQRLFLARALAQDPQIYFMDEPFAGVDAATERAIVDLLQRLRRQGKSVFVVHHDLQTVSSYFDELLMLNLRVVAHGPVAEVFTNDNLQKTYGGRLTLLDQAVDALGRRVVGRGRGG